MFDKSNPNYKLYLAGVINESQYMDLCEEKRIGGKLDPFDPKYNPTSKSVFGTEDEEHDPEIGAAKLKYKAFLTVLTDMSNPKAEILLRDFMPEFLGHTKLTDAKIKKIVLDAIAKRV